MAETDSFAHSFVQPAFTVPGADRSGSSENLEKPEDGVKGLGGGEWWNPVSI